MGSPGQNGAVAVTGASGFLGGHLVRALRERGGRALPLVRVIDARAPDKAELLELILREPDRLRGFAALVHSAAVRHRHGVDAATYRQTNVDLVERLMRAAAGRVARFVYVSSVGVYGFPTKLPVTESTPFEPRTLYSATKLEAERVVRRLGRELEIPFVILRPTIFYGLGDTNGMLDKLAAMIRKGSYRVVGSGDNVLHHTHVDDIVEGTILATYRPEALNDDFILAGPETITLQRLSELVAREIGATVPRVHVPKMLARGVATLVDVARYRGLAFVENEPPINHEKLDVMTVPIAFDAGKARRFGFVPQVDYVKGIAKTLRGSST